MNPTHTNAPGPLPNVPDPMFLRLPAVLRLTGLGRSTVYRMIAEDRFPAPVLLATRAVAWRRKDIEAWSELRRTVSH